MREAKKREQIMIKTKILSLLVVAGFLGGCGAVVGAGVIGGAVGYLGGSAIGDNR